MGYGAARAGHSLLCEKPLRSITQTQERVRLLAANQRSHHSHDPPVSPTQKGFPRLPQAHLTAVGLSGGGRGSVGSCRDLKVEVALQNQKEKQSSFRTQLKVERGTQCTETAEVFFSSVFILGCEHLRHTLGPHLFRLTAASTRR